MKSAYHLKKTENANDSFMAVKKQIETNEKENYIS